MSLGVNKWQTKHHFSTCVATLPCKIRAEAFENNDIQYFNGNNAHGN